MSSLEILGDQPSVFIDVPNTDPLLQFSSKEDPQEFQVVAHGAMTVIAGHMAISASDKLSRQNLLVVGTTDVLDEDQAEEHIKILEMLYGDAVAESGYLEVMNVADFTIDMKTMFSRIRAQIDRFRKLESTMPGMKLGFSTDWAAIVSHGLAVSITQNEFGIELKGAPVRKDENPEPEEY